MKTKCAVAAILISLVFALQASAVLRPLFPFKPSAPFNSEFIVIGTSSCCGSAKRDRAASPELATVARCLDKPAMAFVMKACPVRRLRFRRSSTRGRSGIKRMVVDAPR